jgi:FAD/FMN-containing dehydrogenase
MRWIGKRVRSSRAPGPRSPPSRRRRTRAGFAFGVDIAPRASCTIGGMIATNAGGVHVVRDGMMASQVIGLEAVLADGRIVGRVPGLRKDNAGYHLAALLAGSEGTLAVITRAHLRLIAARPERAAALIAVADAGAAMEVVASLRVRLPSLVAAEILFAEAVALQSRHGAASPLARTGGAVLLIECAGTSSPLDELADGIAGLGALALETAIASDAATVARLWRLRDGVPEAIRACGIAHKIDVALPLERIPEFERRVRRLVGDLAPGAELILFGHAGDGNLHVNVLGLAPEDDGVDEAVLRLVADLGGSIAAEHGVGVAKVAALAAMGNPADLAAMRAVKRALDPSGLLNPGVVLADESARPD